MCHVHPLSTTKVTPLCLVCLACELDSLLWRPASSARAETDGPRAMNGAGARARRGGVAHGAEVHGVSQGDAAKRDSAAAARIGSNAQHRKSKIQSWIWRSRLQNAVAAPMTRWQHEPVAASARERADSQSMLMSKRVGSE
eukprot:3035287-Pleurochrysis_carterae.AAC.1